MTSLQDILVRRLLSISTKVLQYENVSLQAEAKALIPIDKITLQSETQLKNIQNDIKESSTMAEETCIQEIFVFNLMKWFKEDFFTWVDKPDCEQCSGVTIYVNSYLDQACGERVEKYHCEKCDHNTLFQRYDNVKDLLRSKRGRCGEWANCFTFLCRVLGYNARFVDDGCDHVWTEVYLPSQNRWIHCDSCECKMDMPLLYEKGWNKELSYVFAASHEDVQDVTWRYTSDFKSILQRRDPSLEGELIKTILNMNELRQKSLSVQRRKYLAERQVKELVEMLKEPQDTRDLGGRTSGSLAWRLQRGETNDIDDGDGYVFEITKEDIISKKVVLEYSPTSDAYYKNKNYAKPIVKEWRNGVFKCKNVFRKVEHDWKMVYLCRTEGCTEGFIRWSLNLRDVFKKVKAISLYSVNHTVENGKLQWMVSNNRSSEMQTFIKSEGSEGFLSKLNLHSNFERTQYLSIECTFLDGKGDLAWQHAQLFRQSLRNEDLTMCPFQIVIEFED